MNKILQLGLIVLMLRFSACHLYHKGHTEFKGAYICNECDSDIFMTADSQNKTEYYLCMKLRNAHTEVLVRECNREEDALIIGRPRLPRDENTCKVCEVCEARYEIQTCNGDRNTFCCHSDISYVQVNSDGVKVCSPRTLPCKQGQFLVSGNICEPCQPCTYMVENHNSTACSLCQQIPENQEIDGYVATTCIITPNITTHDKPVLDTASFNFSHTPGDPITTGNITGQAGSAPSVRATNVAPILLLLLKAVVINVFLVASMQAKHLIRRGKWLLSIWNCLSNKKKRVLRRFLVALFDSVKLSLFLILGEQLMGSSEDLINLCVFELALICLVFVGITTVSRLLHHSQAAGQVSAPPLLRRG